MASIKQFTIDIAKKILPHRVYLKIRISRRKRIFEKVKKQKSRYNQIIVIGDSHSRFFCGGTPETEKTIHEDENGIINYVKGSDKRFCAFDLGPALAYNLNRSNTSVRASEKYSYLSKNLMEQGEAIICVFGEIDIRVHVFKHVTQNTSYKQVVDVICHNYEQFLKRISDDGYKPIVFGPIASQKDEWRDVVEHPAIGSETERNVAVEYFNKCMKNICIQRGYGFLTIYYKLIDENYRTKAEYIYDKCHLGQNAKALFEPEFEKLVINCPEVISHNLDFLYF